MTAQRRLDSRWWEVAGVVGAALLGAIAVALLLGSQRADVLLFGADSTVMPLVERSIARGEPFTWRMTSTVFAVEIPIFAFLGLFVKSSTALVLVSGVVNYMFLYAMLRWIAAIIAQAWHRAGGVALSLAAVAIPALAVALEVSRTVRTVEFASMLLATSYYYPVLIGMFLAVALIARIVQVGEVAVASFRWRAAGLALATAILVVSNPLFAGWAVAPLSLALIALALWRGLSARLVAATIGAMGVGVVLALFGRELLGDVVGKDATKYIGGVSGALSYYLHDTLIASASTWRGVVEMVLIVILVGLSVYVAVRAFRARPPLELLFAAIAPPLIVVVVIGGAIATGAGAARYLQPVLFAPLISLLVLAELWRRKRADAADSDAIVRSPAPRRAVAVLAVLLLVGGGAATVRLIDYGANTRYTATDCLMSWLDGRDLTGAGDFWIARPMAAFGPEELRLVQMDGRAEPVDWMTNKYDFEQDREISYVVVEQHSWFPTAQGKFSDQYRLYRDTLGEPREIIACDTANYWIFDYTGTEGSTILTRQLSAARK